MSKRMVTCCPSSFLPYQWSAILLAIVLTFLTPLCTLSDTISVLPNASPSSLSSPLSPERGAPLSVHSSNFLELSAAIRQERGQTDNAAAEEADSSLSARAKVRMSNEEVGRWRALAAESPLLEFDPRDQVVHPFFLDSSSSSSSTGAAFSSSSTGAFSNDSSSTGESGMTFDFLSFHLDFPYGPQIETVVSVMLLLFYPVLTFAGVRFFRSTLFILSGVFLASIVYFIGLTINHDSSRDSFIAALIVGALFGYVITKIWKLALIVAGFSVAFVGWLTFRSMFPNVLSNDIALYIALVLPALLCAYAAMKLEKLWLLFSTPVIGSFFLLQGLDHFLKENLSIFYILNNSNNSCFSSRCYYIYSGAIVSAVLGFLIQYRFTSGFYKSRNYRNLDGDRVELDVSRTRRRRSDSEESHTVQNLRTIIRQELSDRQKEYERRKMTRQVEMQRLKDEEEEEDRMWKEEISRTDRPKMKQGYGKQPIKAIRRG